MNKYIVHMTLILYRLVEQTLTTRLNVERVHTRRLNLDQTDPDYLTRIMFSLKLVRLLIRIRLFRMNLIRITFVWTNFSMHHTGPHQWRINVLPSVNANDPDQSDPDQSNPD